MNHSTTTISTLLKIYNDTGSNSASMSDDYNIMINNTNNECDANDYFEGPSENFLLFITILWSVISLIGILANLVVIVVMICGTKLTSATHYFIINLAASDLLFLLTCPTLALVTLNGLIKFNLLPKLLGILICKFDYFSSHVSVFITCLTLMSMTFDRYLVIMHPLKALSYRTKTKAILINLAIWIMSILLSIPHGYYRTVEINPDEGYCTNSKELQEKNINIIFTKINLEMLNMSYTILISYIIPFISILICYFIMLKELRKEKPLIDDSLNRKSNKTRSKSRRRVLIMIALVTILFGFTWLPLHSFLFAMKVFKCFPFANDTLYKIKNLTHTLPYLNSMLNPFFYTIMGNNFRKNISKRFSNNKSKYTNRPKSYYSANDSIVLMNRSSKGRLNSNKSDIVPQSLKNGLNRNSINNSNMEPSDHEQIVLLTQKKNSNF